MADPLLACFGVVLVLGLEKDALVLLDMGLELIIADHGVAEKSELMSRLLLLVIHELVGKLCSRMMLYFFNFSNFGFFLIIILALDMVFLRSCL